MFTSLKEYIAALEAVGELMRIAAPVDPALEIAEITDRVSKSPGGGKALLFEQTGTPFPVLTNMMGSDRRMALALGVKKLDTIGRRIEQMVQQLTAPGRLNKLPLLAQMARWMPREVKGRGECQQLRLDDLSQLPVLKCWPHDGGRFVTLPMVCTLDPDTGVRNVGMYRMQLFDPLTTGMHWHLHKTGERHYQAYKRLGRRMPVSVCLGGDPVYTYAATAPMPDNMDEWLLAGFLRQRPVKLVKCLTNDLWVPSDCDLVIEGYVDPSEPKTTEGPFGDHTGFYSLEDQYPRFHVTAVTARRDAVFPATLVGVPPQEDAYIAKATEKIFLAPMRLALQPEIRDLYMPTPGVAHNIAIVNIAKSYAGQPLKVAHALWGAGQMMFNKVLLVASTDDDIRDERLLEQLLRRVKIPEAVHLSQGVLDVLDHATSTPGEGGKLLIDLTCLHDEPRAELPFALLVDEAAGALSLHERLWLAAANCDPARDVKIEGGRLVIDGRSKPSGTPGHSARWPNVVVSSSETIALVDRRWREYGFTEPIPSPSRRYAPLLLSDSEAL